MHLDFQCRTCSKRFTRKEHLQRHERSHKRETPYACEKCGKQFGRKDLLTRHSKSDACGTEPANPQKKRKPPRCRVACQACIASKCRCVKNSESDKLCVRCAKRNVPCVMRGPENVGDTGRDESGAVVETPSHNGSSVDRANSAGLGIDPRISPLSISALVTPYDDALLGMSPMNTEDHTVNVVGVTNEENHEESRQHSGGGQQSETTGTNDQNNGLEIQGLTDRLTVGQPQGEAVEELVINGEVSQLEELEVSVPNQEPDLVENAPVLPRVEVTDGQIPIDGSSSKTNSEDIDYNLRRAFAYNSTGKQPSELDDGMNWVNKFDLSGVQNLIRNVMDVANEINDTASDVLESYITSKRADFFSETNIEKYFDQLLDFDAAFYDSTPSDRALSVYGRSNGNSPEESRDSRSEAFVGSSLAWKKPSANAAEKEVKSVEENDMGAFSNLDMRVDQNSSKFKKFEVTLKTRDLLMFNITEVHNGHFWKDRAKVHLPLPEELTLLVVEYFERFHTRYHIVHLPTFDPNEVHSLLLLAVLAAGAFFSESHNEALNKLGRYFFEIGRRKIILEFENNNSNIRDIQLQQANLILFITASWSGIDRNVELSQSFTFTLSTMTRRGDMFKLISYSTLEEIMEDQSLSTIDEKWMFWVYLESKKLLVYVLFYWCSQFSVILNFPSFVNYSELELPLPHLEPFWRASNASEWMKMVESLKVQSPQQYMHHISFQLLIGPLLSSREYSGPSLSPKFFTDVIMGTLIATVRQFVSEQNDRVAFTNSIPKVSDVRKKKRRTMSLDATFHMTYLVNRQAEIENMLESLETYVSNQSTKRQNLYKLEIEYSFVCLYSSIKDCMKLAGIDGEVESRQSIPRLLEWFKKDDSRLAIWHCAQILRLLQFAIANNICMLRTINLEEVSLLTKQSCPTYRISYSIRV